MPRTRRGAGRRDGAWSYTRLERRLTLLSWLHERLGFSDTRALLEAAKPTREGFDENGRSHMYALLSSRADSLRGITESDLARYDDNIRAHLAAMNAGRADKVTLRYFQYLAALYAEIFLDRYAASPAALLESLNDHARRLNETRRGDDIVDPHEAADLKKLAFWMATGSGKTLLMHLNYRQYLGHVSEQPDSVLLITPDEGLSNQHLNELRASGIPARRFDPNEIGSLAPNDGAMRVTEITKLVMEKRGDGQSVPVEAFEGSNLVFVDEGHRGAGGEAWREVRDAIARDGFTFEYSATFGQALTAARDDALTAEYGKAIAFDYSYRYFYGDGYGKDFNVLNLHQETTEDFTNTLLLANMLSFYEQQRVYAERNEKLRPYGLERPLWLFVGGSVNAVRTERGRPASDVLTIARFLHKTLTEERWAVETIERLLAGESGLEDVAGRDLFEGKYAYLQGSGNADHVYRDMLARTLRAPSGGGLRLADVRGSKGELGLRAGASDDYFGLIYIGDTGKFKNLARADDAGITVEDDAVSNSLFDEIGRPGGTIDVLIGARKFIEGWNSWRVSNMGLLNIGTNEGSQIIQLFGRGVRLRGLDMTLKRSSALAGQKHPDHIGLLETLNIFALRANYMAQFRAYLEREGVAPDTPLELPLFVRPNREFLRKGLVVPRVDDERDFKAEVVVPLDVEDGIKVEINAGARAQAIGSGPAGPGAVAAGSGAQIQILAEGLAMVRWNEVFTSLLEYKQSRGMDNLVVRPTALRRIMEAGPSAYELTADASLVEPDSAEQWTRLQDTVTSILRQYADRLYRRRRARWESDHMKFTAVDETDGNLRFNIAEGKARYIVGVPRSEMELVREIERLIEDCNRLYRTERGALPRIHFDRHIYQPLLTDVSDKLTVAPPGLNESERKFVEDLRSYWKNDRDGLPDGTEAFLLRNQGRGAGVGFFEDAGFYPDFILWVKDAARQRVVFVEPHGMVYANAYKHDEKARLHERIGDLSRTISERSNRRDVVLDSYIVSATSYEDLYKRYGNGDWSRSDFAERHILFPERNAEYDYMKEIFALETAATP